MGRAYLHLVRWSSSRVGERPRFDRDRPRLDHEGPQFDRERCRVDGSVAAGRRAVRDARWTACLALGLAFACAHPAPRPEAPAAPPPTPQHQERTREREVRPPPPPQRLRRHIQTGVASYYGSEFEGRLTASGARYRGRRMTCAHRTLPFGTVLRVTAVESGRSVVVEVNDRGPYAKGRLVDLSHAAAQRLGMLEHGVARVTVEILR